MNVYRVLLCLLALSVWVANALAQDADDFINMSLDELLNVSIASTRIENIAQTPAVVSRFEASDMAHLGLDTLEDMLAFIPGFVVQDTEIGTAAIMIRGLVESFNQKVLFLLDGVPYWQPAHGDNALLGIPFESISRVEVIRGPGAVIYGTNATGGVVNVITRELDNTRIDLVGGSNGLAKFGLFMGGEWAGKGRLSLMVAGKRDNGYSGYFNHRVPPPFYPEDTPLEGNIQRYEEHNSLQLRFSGARLKAGLHVFGSDSSGLAAAASLVNEAELKYRGYLTFLNYEIQKERYNFMVFADYNNFFLEIPTASLFAGRFPGVQSFSDDGADNYRLRGGVRYSRTVRTGVDVLVGMEQEKRSIGEYGNTSLTGDFTRVVTMEAGTVEESSFYGQVDWMIGSWRFLLGGRHVDNELAGSDLNPRLAGIYSFDDKRSIKALYSVGFNSPNFIQQGLNIPFVVAGDPEIKAEKVKTIDLAYTYSNSKRLIVVNGYWLEAEDFIRRVPNPNAPGSLFQNADNFTRHGVEVDYQQDLKGGRLFANLAWQKEGNKVLANDGSALFAPQWKVSLGGSRVFASRHKLGGSAIWISDREAVSSRTNVNLSYGLKIGRSTWFARINNLLSEDLSQPDVANFRENRISPGGDPDLNGRLGFQWNF